MIFFDRKIWTQNFIFTYKTFPHSPPYHFKTAIFHSFWSFSEVKKHFSETTKGVIGKKLLGSSRPYMSYPMKFSFYLHQTYGYWHNWEKLKKKIHPKSKLRVLEDFFLFFFIISTTISLMKIKSKLHRITHIWSIWS